MDPGTKRHGLAALILAGLAAAFPIGCTEGYVTAVGPNGEATLFSDAPIGDARRDVARGLLTRRIPTPVRPESAFKLETADSTGFRLRRTWRNLVFLADMRSGSWSAAQCRRILDGDAHRRLVAGEAGYVFARDVWADGQTVLCLHAADAGALERLLASQGDRILDEFFEGVILGLRKTIFVGGEQSALMEGIRGRHGYSVRIPTGFFVEEQAENRYVRMKEVLANGAVMFLSVYYQPQVADTLLPGACMALRDTLAAIYSGKDRIDPSRTKATPIQFQGRRALEIYGLYQNLHPPMGGPFKTICFHDGGRLYLIDLAVFNPPGDKLPQLRILESIARTFSTDGAG